MDGIAQRILYFNQSRDQGKISLKYDAIRESSFRFLRGTCHLFYEDLSKQYLLPDSPDTWLCGDLHLENFGSFKGSDREVYFDINDFDEAILGPALYELSRLLVSIELACRNANYEKPFIETLLNSVITGYCKILQSGKPVTVENATANGLVKKLLDKVTFRKEKKLVKERADSGSGYENLVIDSKRTFGLEPSFKKELIRNIQAFLDETHGKNLRKVHDTAYLVAGTGSIGINRYLALTSDTGTDKKYLLVMKQALPSSLISFLHVKQPSWTNDAQRISEVQFRMQHVTPGGLGVLPFRNDWYIIRWIQPEADKINLADFLANQDQQSTLMETIGCLTASAQLRSGGRDGSAITDELIRFGSRQDWIAQLFSFVETYAEQVEKDYNEYCYDYDNGYFNTRGSKK